MKCTAKNDLSHRFSIVWGGISKLAYYPISQWNAGSEDLIEVDSFVQDYAYGELIVNGLDCLRQVSVIFVVCAIIHRGNTIARIPYIYQGAKQRQKNSITNSLQLLPFGEFVYAIAFGAFPLNGLDHFFVDERDWVFIEGGRFGDCIDVGFTADAGDRAHCVCLNLLVG